MKTIRNIAAIAVIAASLTACGSSENKSIGGSADTTTTKNSSDQGVSSVGGVDSTSANTTAKDSTNSTEGNAPPTGRP
jgi:hypothetical protein